MSEKEEEEIMGEKKPENEPLSDTLKPLRIIHSIDESPKISYIPSTKSRDDTTKLINVNIPYDQNVVKHTISQRDIPKNGKSKMNNFDDANAILNKSMPFSHVNKTNSFLEEELESEKIRDHNYHLVGDPGNLTDRFLTDYDHISNNNQTRTPGLKIKTPLEQNYVTQPIPIISTTNQQRGSSNNNKNLSSPLQAKTHISYHKMVPESPPTVGYLKHKNNWNLKKCLYVLCTLLAFLVFSFMVYAFVIRSRYSKIMKKVRTDSLTCYTPECVKIAAILLEGINVNADPCDDFYEFACGSWNRYHIIPEDRSSISTFEVLSSRLQILLKELLEEGSNKTDMEAVDKAKRMYISCVNTTQGDLIGDTPVKNTLNSMGGWPILNTSWVPHQNFSMEILLAQLFLYNTPAYLEILVGPDDKNSSLNILQLDQNTLVLPSREYYLNPESNIAIRAYKRLVYTIALLMGASGSNVQQEADDIVNLEIEIALASVPSADRHDASAIYHKMSLKKLSEIVPEFDWMKFIHYFPNDFLITEDEKVVVYSETFLKVMGKLFQVTPVRRLVNYALWRHINSYLPHLPRGYIDAFFAFRKVIYGVSAPVIRWQQCVEYVADHMAMPVGAMFVGKHFRKGSKETALEMIHDIREAFNELLETNTWMDDETRKVAEEKANSMNELIGYPDTIYNDEELKKEFEEINTKGNFLNNVIAIGMYEFTKNFAELRKPVIRNSWSTGPAVVNAFYSPNKNNIVIPAGILQPLFYSETFPKSLNYGGIGVVIGHEITHGFDEKGRQFDKRGNLKQWWNNSTIKAFRKRAKCIIDQYSKYKLKEINLHINGRNTQGENIADNGGLKQAFRAYQKWTSNHGQEKLIPSLNLTHNQLFFLNYAQIWCGSMRPEEALNKIHSSVHSPGPIRVIGPLSNSIDFSNAYNCPLGSKMNPVKKCNVW
ncbi:unnamed protein product [Gordionus sp. m RMFG-2023]|uniref:neprilysin-1-like n=1 Tax=Gordionus sp. m RMFG-2023 TaxID=3053472 RepID=UPI0030E4F361